MGTGGRGPNAPPHLLDDVFWVMYGDSYMDIDYAPCSTFDRSGRKGS
jgi:NDP-sugar pyrophosphorylase family protein